MLECNPEDVVEVILPHLISSLSTWQYLSARARATSLSSAAATDSPAAVTTDDAKSDVDVSVMLREYSTLQQCVRGFCDRRLEVRTDPVEDCGKTVERSPEKHPPASSSEVPNDRDIGPERDGVLASESSDVPNIDGTEHADDRLTARTYISFSETSDNTDSCAKSRVSSMQLNGGPLDRCIDLLCSADSNSEHIDNESRELNGDKLVTGNFCASAGNKNPTSENFCESHGDLCTDSATTVTNGVVTCAAEKSDNGELAASDCRNENCGTVAVYSADGDAVKTEKPGTEKPDAESGEAESGVTQTTNDTHAETDLQTPCSDDASESVVKVVNDMLEVSTVNWDHSNCLCPDILWTRKRVPNGHECCYYVVAKATYIRLLLAQNGGFSALAP